MFGATEQNLLKLFEYLINSPFELPTINHTEMFKRPESGTKIIY